MNLKVGAVVGENLRIDKLLGEGAFAEVYLATHTEYSRLYAIKLLKWQMGENPKLRQRFLDEAMIMRGIKHRNVVTVHRLILNKDEIMIAMDYLPRGSLHELVQNEGSMLSKEACRFFIQVCEGLGVLHQAGVIHRDVKPANILIDENRNPCITDFGIATERDQNRNRTKYGSEIGTEWFMPPEQQCTHEGGQDQRADIYAIGVTLHAAVTGLVDGVEDVAYFNKAVRKKPELLERVIEPLRRVIIKATADHLVDRYQDTDEMIAALREASRMVPSVEEEREARRVPLQTMVPEVEGNVVVGTRFSLGGLAASGGGAAVSSEVSTGHSVAVPVATRQARKELPQGGTMVSAGEDSPRLSRRAIAVFAAVASVILFVVYGFWLRTSPSVQPMRTHPEAVTFTEEESRVGGVGESEVDVGAGSPSPEGTDGKVEVPLKPEVKTAPKKVVKSEPKAKVTTPVVVEAPKTRVTVSGDATQVRLVGDAGSFTLPTSVPFGMYRVVATFDGEPEAVTAIKRLEVDDKPVAIVCDSSFARCNRE